ncbi:MAG: ABC transporter permease subunit [Gemmobacter sp.]|uniref:ABC transporter permease subunit n=1 Tax=Gemmobacter sp. TaxID=1898957 RepID=UPI00391C39FB
MLFVLGAVVTILFFLFRLMPGGPLAIHAQGLTLRRMRSNMLDVMKEDFVIMARIKGVPSFSVVIRLAARNALLPVMTSFAIAVGYGVVAQL